MVKLVTSLAEYTDILAKNPKVIVDYFADWCGPCQRIAPTIDKLSQEFTNIVTIKVNVDEAEEIAIKENISSMPTFKAFKANQLFKQIVGASEQNINQFYQDLNKA